MTATSAATSNEVKMADLAAQYESIRAEAELAVGKVLSGGRYILGENVRAFEGEMASYCEVKHAIGVSSGTDALRLAMMALQIGAGDEVICPSFTFVSPAECALLQGAKPVYCDILQDTFNADPAHVESLITARTRAVVAVDLYGQISNFEQLETVCARHNLPLIEDGAQSIGATRHGRCALSFGAIACTSFYPSKNLGAAGDGGMVFTQSDDVAAAIRLMRDHGNAGGYVYKSLGANARLDELQAAILRLKLRMLDQWNAARNRLARMYDELLADLPVQLPVVEDGCYHNFYQYTLRAPKRDELAAYLGRNGIQYAVYYPIPIHLQATYANPDQPAGSLPQTEKAAREVISIPIAPEIGEAGVRRTAEVIRSFYQKS
jgi:dTDP-4-amino-4,6-dideoxygalactose transaminase